MNKNNRRTDRLDALEARLTGPKRIALFGHRNVGKTTLLAMFYRQASSGRIAGLRLAAADARSAEYLAEKIAQIESGQPMAGSLAETELKLRLYHGPARFDLIVKDYQGEHVTLGTEEPIQEFFADCDAVLLCLDPEGSAEPAERRRRQQEVENLLERYIDRSDDLSMGRPVALLIDQVRPGARQPGGQWRRNGSRRAFFAGVCRATGRRAIWDDAARAGGARARRGDFRGELVWPECQRQPAAGRAPPHGPGRTAQLGRRAA